MTRRLLPAKAADRACRRAYMAGKRRITWVHFACDRHEVVRCERLLDRVAVARADGAKGVFNTAKSAAICR